MRVNLPSISIIIVSYNQGHLIEQAIQSVVNQKYPSLQLIIIDALSTDQTESVLNKYISHISVLIQEKDRGMYHARNKGIFLSTGMYVGFLNADDVLFNNALYEIAETIIENNYPEMLFGYTVGLTFDNEIMSNVLIGPNIDLSHRYFNKMKTIPDQSTFYKRDAFSFIGLYDTSLKFGADTDLKCRFIRNKTTICTLPKTIAGWRIHEETLTHKREYKYKRLIEALKVNFRYNKNVFNYYNLRLILHNLVLIDLKKYMKRILK